MTEDLQKHFLYRSRILLYSNSSDSEKFITSYVEDKRLHGLNPIINLNKGFTLLSEGYKKGVRYHLIILDLQDANYNEVYEFYLNLRKHTFSKRVPILIFNEKINDTNQRLIQARNFAKEEALKNRDNLQNLMTDNSGAEEEDTWISDHLVRFIDRNFEMAELEDMLGSVHHEAFPKPISNIKFKEAASNILISIPNHIDEITTNEIADILSDSKAMLKLLDFSSVKYMPFQQLQILLKMVVALNNHVEGIHSINVNEDVLELMEQRGLTKSFNVIESLGEFIKDLKRKAQKNAS